MAAKIQNDDLIFRCQRTPERCVAMCSQAIAMTEDQAGCGFGFIDPGPDKHAIGGSNFQCLPERCCGICLHETLPRSSSAVFISAGVTGRAVKLFCDEIGRASCRERVKNLGE